MRGRRAELNTYEGQVINFLIKIRRSDGCWEWLGRRQNNKYGSHTFYGRDWLAHRLAYQLLKGDVSPDLDVCHHCDNPICVNPDHLFLGTHLDNMRDMVRKGRLRVPKKWNSPHAKLTQEQRKAAILMIQEGDSYDNVGKQFNVSPFTIRRIVKQGE